MNEYGICYLSMIPVRTSPSDKSELCTQLVFGELYQIIQQNANGKWLEIKTQYDAYQGWIDALQFSPISVENWNQLASRYPIAYITTDAIGFLMTDNLQIPIVAGSFLPFLEEDMVYFHHKKWKFKGNYRLFSTDFELDFFLQSVFQYLRTPYLWGGRTPLGIDCSGFTQQVFKLNGIKLPRDAYQQAEKGNKIDFELAQTGDLAFFYREERIIHVGIVLEKKHLPSYFLSDFIQDSQKLIVHSLDCVRIDLLDESGIFHIERKYYTHQLKMVKRVINFFA